MRTHHAHAINKKSCSRGNRAYASPLKPTVKIRANITLDQDLHAWVHAHATKSGTNVSAYISRLLQQARGDAKQEITVTRKDLDALRQEIAEDVFRRLSGRPGGG